MYDDFLKPTCLIGLFAPPEELSAAVVLSTFWFYALAHQASFDVCWVRLRFPFCACRRLVLVCPASVRRGRTGATAMALVLRATGVAC